MIEDIDEVRQRFSSFESSFEVDSDARIFVEILIKGISKSCNSTSQGMVNLEETNYQLYKNQ